MCDASDPYWAQGDQPVANPIYQGSPPSEEEVLFFYLFILKSVLN